MAETKQRTCEERIEEQLRGRVDDLAAYVKGCDVADKDEEELTDEEIRTATNIYDVAEARKEWTELNAAARRERCEEAIRELPLSVETRRIVDVCISTGGPEDRFEFHMDFEGRSIERIFYVFKDWFDGARRELEGSDFEAVERAAELAGWTEAAG